MRVLSPALALAGEPVEESLPLSGSEFLPCKLRTLIVMGLPRGSNEIL